MKKVRSKLLMGLLVLTCCLYSANCHAQMDEKEVIQWKHFVHSDFELSMPVSKANYRPIKVPKKESLVKELLPSIKIHDLLNYEGSNELFFCTVQVSALEGEVSLEGMVTKLRQLVKQDYSVVKDKRLISDEIDRVKNYTHLKMIYTGKSEVYAIHVYMSERQIVTLLLSDLSDNQKWTEKFLQSFVLRSL